MTVPAKFPLFPLIALLLFATGAVAAGVAVDSDPSASIPESGVAAGDVVEIPLEVDGTVEVDVRGGPDGPDADAAPYRATLRATDADGDGRVTLVANTHREGAAAYDARGGTVEVESAEGSFEPGEYRAVAPESSRRFAVEEPAVRSLSVYRAPPEASEELRTAADVRRANESGELLAVRSERRPEARTVGRNETMVVELRASGLEGVFVGADPDADPVELLRTHVRESSAEFAARQSYPSPELPTKYLDLLDPEAARLIPDAPNGTYYLVVDVAALDAGYAPGETDEEANLRPEEYYVVEFSHEGALSQTPGARDGETAAQITFLHGATITPEDDDETVLAPERNETVSGYVDAAPWGTVSVVLDGEQRREAPARIHRAGERTAFEASFDLRNASGEHEVTVLVDGEPVESDGSTVVVAEPDGALSLDDQSGGGYRVTVEDVTATHGGTLVAYRGEVGGEVLGERRVAPGAYRALYVPFDEPLREDARVIVALYRPAERPGAEPRPYRSDEDVATASARYEYESPSSSGGTPTESETPEPESPGTPSAEIQPTTTAATSPTDGAADEALGFGVVVALSALLATAMATAVDRRTD